MRTAKSTARTSAHWHPSCQLIGHALVHHSRLLHRLRLRRRRHRRRWRCRATSQTGWKALRLCEGLRLSARKQQSRTIIFDPWRMQLPLLMRTPASLSCAPSAACECPIAGSSRSVTSIETALSTLACSSSPARACERSMRLTGCSLMQPAYIRRCSVCTKDRRTDRRTDTSEKRVPAARTVRLPAARVGPVRCAPVGSCLIALGCGGQHLKFPV